MMTQIIKDLVTWLQQWFYTEDEVNDLLDDKQDNLISGTSIKTLNNESLLGSGNISVGGSITIDSALSSTSTNPVQNKVIKSALEDTTKYYKITSSNYNPTINTSITITVTVTDGTQTGVSNHSFTLSADGTDVSLTTNSDGVATYTYTCNNWGLRTFSVLDKSIQINVKGWKSTAITSVITLWYNETFCYLEFHGTVNVGQNNNYKHIATVPDGYRPYRQVIGFSQESYIGIRINESGQIQTSDIRGTATSWGMWVQTPKWRYGNL